MSQPPPSQNGPPFPVPAETGNTPNLTASNQGLPIPGALVSASRTKGRPPLPDLLPPLLVLPVCVLSPSFPSSPFSTILAKSDNSHLRIINDHGQLRREQARPVRRREAGTWRGSSRSRRGTTLPIRGGRSASPSPVKPAARAWAPGITCPRRSGAGSRRGSGRARGSASWVCGRAGSWSARCSSLCMADTSIRVTHRARHGWAGPRPGTGPPKAFTQ